MSFLAKLKLWSETLKMIKMKNLNDVEMLSINGGTVDENKERSGFTVLLNSVGSALSGFAGMVGSWF